MGFAASVGRELMLTARSHDIGMQINLLNQNKLQIAGSVTRLLALGANLDPASPQGLEFNTKRAQLAQIEKVLDVQLELKKVELKAVQTEMEALQKTISENVKVFKLMGGA